MLEQLMSDLSTVMVMVRQVGISVVLFLSAIANRLYRSLFWTAQGLTVFVTPQIQSGTSPDSIFNPAIIGLPGLLLDSPVPAN